MICSPRAVRPVEERQAIAVLSPPVRKDQTHMIRDCPALASPTITLPLTHPQPIYLQPIHQPSTPPLLTHPSTHQRANGPATIASAETSSCLEAINSGLDDSTGQQGIGSSSNSKFLGHYAITSSQHQMGKNDIDSSTFLSGSFSMEKSVKFQDRGI